MSTTIATLASALVMAGVLVATTLALSALAPAASALI